MDTITIRPATAPDCADIASIYRHYVENSVITFDYDAPSVTDWKAKRASLLAAGRPFLVAASGDRILGFAYLSEFRAKQAYRWTTEDTIYLHPDATGRGVGKRLLRALLEACDPRQVRRVVAVIAATDEVGATSVALHERAGFTEVGRLPANGYKNGQWIDCVYMQYDVPEEHSPGS